MELTTFILLIVIGYLLGSLPLSFLVAKWRGTDLRKQGTGQVGGGNLWRTTSRKLGLIIGVFDFVKGMIMVAIAFSQGLEVYQQTIIGLAVVIGHNWPVFLKFHGGRGAATTLGLVLFIPAINQNVSPWSAIVVLVIVVLGSIVLRSTPVPTILAAASLPISYWALGSDTGTVLAFLGIFLAIALKRLMSQTAAERPPISNGRLLLNRFFFDRDFGDRKAWMAGEHIDDDDILNEVK